LFAAETGGTQLVEDGEAQFNSEAGLGVAEFWRTMYDEGLSPQEAHTGDSLADEVAAMAIVGPWAIAAYTDTIDWGAVPIPTSGGTAPEETWTFSDAKNVAMYSACENRATAWDVMKFATSEEQDGSLLELTGQMPLRTDLATTYADYFTANPTYEQFADQAARTVEVPNVPNSVEIWQEFRDAWSSSVIFGQEDIQPTFETAASTVTDLAAGS
jgi:multiple sugar transport system substrate-binding protein